MAWLHLGWGNTGFSAEPDYVLEVAQRALRAKTVLECGSGLTSIALGCLGVPTWSLEHHPEWANRVRRALERIDARSVSVHDTPLRSYGELDWYSVPDELPEQFDLVVCDGPPGQTRGGRQGLWTVLTDRIMSATILLDDAHRPAEQELLATLRAEGWLENRHRLPGGRSFAVLYRPS